MSKLIVKDLGLVPYEHTWHQMQSFTQDRTPDAIDELWLLEHSPVFTQGQAGKAEHLLNPGDIPVVQVDRGGQVTYHGPGQLVAYVLLDVKRSGWGVRELVSAIEQSVVQTLASYDIEAYPKKDAPGVYVNEEKIASLGLRIKRGKSFHGLGFNLDMDLAPFDRINPCGYAGLQMTQLKSFVDHVDMQRIKRQWTEHFAHLLNYDQVSWPASLEVPEHG